MKKGEEAVRKLTPHVVARAVSLKQARESYFIISFLIIMNAIIIRVIIAPIPM